MDKQKIKAFWDAVPDDLGMEGMADGVIIRFRYKGDIYEVNTRIEQARTKSFQTCYLIWDTRANNAEKKGGESK